MYCAIKGENFQKKNPRLYLGVTREIKRETGFGGGGGRNKRSMY